MKLRLVLFALSPIVLAPPLRAQLELPDRPSRPAGESATPPELATKPRGDLAERVTGKGQRPSDGELVLPDAVETATGSNAATGAETDAPAAPIGPVEGPALFILNELARVKDPESRLVAQAVQSLIALGEPGRSAARAALASDHVPTLLCGAQVLLSTGFSKDGEHVVSRARGRLPNAGAGKLVETLCRFDPVLASPRLLCELLGHPQAGVRAAAFRELQRQVRPELVLVLPRALESEPSDGRLRAIELAEQIGTSEALALLFDRLKDKSGQVAARAARALASGREEQLDGELLARAFRNHFMVRESAYALLALVEREDLQVRAILGPEHAESLLAALGQSDPFVSGAAAAALAGLGFRLPEGERTRWLDLQVPHRLVRVVAGQDFSNDLSSVAAPCARRLALISGEGFGSNGPAWLAWWTRSASAFRAARAVIAARVEEADGLALVHYASVGAPEAFVLVGDKAPRAGLPPLESFVLSADQARELFLLLEREGVFSAQRLPGVRGAKEGPGRMLEVRLGNRGKSFRFAGASGEEWFERACGAALALRERQRWQRYAPAEAGAAWLHVEGAWWNALPSELERARRLKSLVLAHLATTPVTERATGLAELQRTAQVPGAIESADFTALLALLGAENSWNARAKVLFTLVEAAAQSLRGPDQPLEVELARDLAGALSRSIGGAAAREIARVLSAAGREHLTATTRDPDPLLRAVAAAELARGALESDLPTFEALLADPVLPVQVATLLALGQERVEFARTDILLRARHGDPKSRAAALEAAGHLGGEGVSDALVLALHDDDRQVQLGALEGLAALRDPLHAALLVQVLASERASPHFDVAKQGLLALGATAHEELLRVAGGSQPGRRAAALLLAEQSVPNAAPVLMTLLTEDPNDTLAESELAILTGVDLRGELSPAAAWWNWWDGVRHDDALAWLCAALERAGISAPPAEAFGSQGSRAGFECLLAALARPEVHLAERARRELSCWLGRDLGHLPSEAGERAAWIAALRELGATRWP